MIYTIDLINEDQLKYINDILDVSDYVKGQTTTGLTLDVKNNLQAVGYEANNLRHYVVEIINSSSDFIDTTLSKRYAGLIFSKYSGGMYYHSHNDNYAMGDVRTDYSCTIFLNDPSEYEGGELVLTLGNQEIPYKLKAGQCVIYPTGLKHRVNEITSGERKVCVFWVESFIEDYEARNIISDFNSMWNKYGVEIQEKLGNEAYYDILNVKFRLMRKYGNFATIKNGT
jgi:PKHD-type hydroxylase